MARKKKILFANTHVVFDEQSHTYDINGIPLMGVTSLMKKHGLSADYSGISEEVLAHAAEMGTMAHKCIEDYCDGLPVVENKLIKSFKKLGLDVAATELLISDEENVASSIDLVGATGEEDTFDLIDMKRTSTVHKDALAWQLGIYRYLLEMQCKNAKVRDCYCLHIKKGDTDSIDNDTCMPLIKIEPKSREEVRELLKAESEGRLYTPEHRETEAVSLIEDSALAKLIEGEALIASLDAQIKTAKSAIEDIKNELYQKMLSENIDELTHGDVVIKLKRPYSTTKLDTALLKNKYAEIYDLACKTSEVKGNISIKIK